MQKANYQHSELTEKIIRAFFTVYNTLGYGFLEAVYEKSLVIELIKLGLDAKTQTPIEVHYDGFKVGHYFADILVNDTVIVELKAIKNLIPENEAQLQNYLKATGLDVGLLLNFGLKPEFKRRTRPAK